MAVGRAERFAERRPRVVAVFGSDAATIRAVEHVFELLERAWHDSYGEVSPSEVIVDQILLCSGGTLRDLVAAARLAVVDRRDLAVWAARARP
jgi:hypothetical protein